MQSSFASLASRKALPSSSSRAFSSAPEQLSTKNNQARSGTRSGSLKAVSDQAHRSALRKVESQA